ncbi:hypothetical protein GCM10010299_40340 [Streptomyces tanashiensis]|nr:hypothetical protein GCM10010299_40340 [Streptomyces tanashiensis]
MHDAERGERIEGLVHGREAVLYFGARTDAGLGRARTMTAVGFAGPLLLGLALTRLYDRKGLHRSDLRLTPAGRPDRGPPGPGGPRSVPWSRAARHRRTVSSVLRSSTSSSKSSSLSGQ